MQLFKQFWCHTNSFSSLKLIPVLKVQSTEEDTTPLISTHCPKIIKQYTSVSAVTVTASAFNADIHIIFVTVHPEVFVPALSLLLRS